MELFLRVGLGNVAAAGVLALGAASVGVIARRRPALRHGLWLLVLLKLVTPPLWTVPVAWVAGPVEAAVEPPPAPASEGDRQRAEVRSLSDPFSGDATESDIDAGGERTAVAGLALRPDAEGLAWGRWVLAAWGSGSLLTFGLAAWRIRRFQRLLGLAEPASESLHAQVEALAARL